MTSKNCIIRGILAVEEFFGDIDGFVRTGLKLTDEEIRKLREMYLDV